MNDEIRATLITHHSSLTAMEQVIRWSIKPVGCGERGIP